MKFPKDAPVTAAKLKALQARLARLGMDLKAVREKAVKAGGPGGQKVNKTSSGVQLRCEKLGIVVKWTRERSHALNRFLALRELVDEIECAVSPETAPRLKRREKVRKQKARRRRRARASKPIPEAHPGRSDGNR